MESSKRASKNTKSESRRPSISSIDSLVDMSKTGNNKDDSSDGCSTANKRRRHNKSRKSLLECDDSAPMGKVKVQNKRRRLDESLRRQSSFTDDEYDNADEDADDDEVDGDDVDGSRSESDGGEEEEELRIEKIFACRWRLPTTRTSDSRTPPSLESMSTGPVGRQVSSEDSSPCSVDEKDMEYFVKFEGMSYRDLCWKSKSELVDHKNDAADMKILHFHRKMTSGDPKKEHPLSLSDEGNFDLYCKIDRIIGVRQVEEYEEMKGGAGVVLKKHFLVKWQLLGYAESTWESEESLASAENQEEIRRFNEISCSFEFPVCAPAPGMTMAATATAGSSPQRRKTTQQLEETTTTTTKGLIEGEIYTSEAVTNQEGSTRLWQMFLKRKLAADATYIPSIQWHNKSKKTYRSLMGHQQEGIKWLFFNTEVHRHGSLLADEMGLGKTCQSIAFVEHLLDVMSAGRSLGSHALVVVQKSVLENWRREFRIWTPHLNVLPIGGGKKDREIIQKYEYKWMDIDTGEMINPPHHLSCKKLIKPDVVLVTYEGLRTTEFQQLTSKIKNFKWTCVVVDECQKVKGGKSSLLLSLLSQLKREITILLTGTPIQNTTEELFPMLTLVDPLKFSFDENTKNYQQNGGWSLSKFNSKFSQIQERENCMQLTEELHQLMAPYILRREKAHVLKTLPPKTVKLVKIPLTLLQKRVYSALYHKSIRTKGLKLSNIHMLLRKCCIHPYLIEGMEELIYNGKIDNENDVAEVKVEEDTPMDPNNETHEEKAKRLILESSGKFVLLKKMLEKFREQKRKVLIFSFFKSALDLIEDFISIYQFSWKIERVDGETSGEERQLAIDRFNSDSGRFLFLCTTRAGGLGINLTSASVVIHLDSDFNPQHDLQAQARCHRIGQNKNVDVYHYIAEHTYEDYMLFTIAGKKLGLEAVLLGRLDATKGKAKLDKQQEEKVLRKGVFAALRDDEAAGKEAREFAEQSIDEILSTKATTVVLEGDQEDDNEDQKTTTERTTTKKEGRPLFATALFAGQRRDLEGLNEDEPDFWVKIAQRLGPWVLEEEKPQELTRADRRRGRNVNYKSAFYDEDFYLSETSGRRKSHKRSEDNARDRQDDDELFSSPNSTGSGDVTDSCDSELDSVVKEDLEIAHNNNGGEKVKQQQQVKESKRHRPFVSCPVEEESNRKRLRDQMNWQDWTELQPISPPSNTNEEVSICVPPLQTSSTTNPLTTTLNAAAAAATASDHRNSYALPSGPLGHAVILDLLLRCLRALERWKATKVGETGGLRTDDIRDADRCSPWSSALILQRTGMTTGADHLLRQSWLETFQEWKQAGNDFENLKNNLIDKYAKQILQNKRDVLELHWMKSIKSISLTTIKSKEQLIQQMNGFFVAEARKLAILTFGESIVRELQNVCHELAVKVLTGRHFSREYTIKKQTWIGSEDFCIKLVFVHLMAQKYASGGHQQMKSLVMRWPPPQLEVNWAIITEVIKKLNKYTGGPERRRAAIHERYYNKLDSRWNHDDFNTKERDVLSLAVANGLAAHIVAEELPGRSLERVKKGLRCPAVIRDAQKDDLLIQKHLYETTPGSTSEHKEPSSLFSGAGVVDIVSKFREICRDLGLSPHANHRRVMKQLQPPPPPTTTTTIAAASSSEPSSSCSQPSKMSSAPPLWPIRQDKRENSQQLTTPTTLLIQSIRSVLLRIGVQVADFETLRPSLLNQPISSLSTLLKQLRDVQEQQTDDRQDHLTTHHKIQRGTQPVDVIDVETINQDAHYDASRGRQLDQSSDRIRLSTLRDNLNYLQTTSPPITKSSSPDPPSVEFMETSSSLSDCSLTTTNYSTTLQQQQQPSISQSAPPLRGAAVSQPQQSTQSKMSSSLSPTDIKNSILSLLKVTQSSPNQLAEIQNRIQKDPHFAQLIVDHITRQQQHLSSTKEQSMAQQQRQQQH